MRTFRTRVCLFVVLLAALPNSAFAQPVNNCVLQLDFEPTGLALPYSAELRQGAKLEIGGPTSAQFEQQPDENHALVLAEDGAYLRIGDQADAGFDFGNGDAITIEAWVKLDKQSNGANIYVIGKGRTYETQRIENQNYALRLTMAGGEARPSFLFATQADNSSEIQYHRWTADRGFVPDGHWHYVATSYRYGAPESIAGYCDGEKVKGKWDMAGPTQRAPIVDNDALWIGSSRGGEKGNSLRGALDNIAIHRELVSAEILNSRRRPVVRPPTFPADHDDSRVTITLHAEQSSHSVWPAVASPPQSSLTTSHLAFHRLPMRYLAGGLRAPWRGPMLLRAFCRTELPAGELTWLVRSPGLSRLWIDGRIALTTPPHPLFPDAHQPFEVYQADHPWLRVPRAGDTEKRVTLELDAGLHEIVLEQIVGAKGIRCETGDTTVAIRRGDELFTLVGPKAFETPLSEEGWAGYREELEASLSKLEARLRHETTNQESDFWNQRHNLSRQWLQQTAADQPELPAPTAGLLEKNDIDRWLNSTLADVADKAILNEVASDATFVRRLYLDTVGVQPTAAQLREFIADTSSDKRAKLIDRLLADERWADHWTSYWQDVLAENPSILKPTLNNTGPFRWWIYDSLVENKPMDRFVTELIRMEGDKLGGGAAGFAMASENDVPMAAKAHILTAAFLGVEMKCARCHDSPYHPWTQKQLFGLAAMLENKPLKVPATSSVPKEFFERKQGHSPITLSIFPGDEIEPRWPFEDLASAEPVPQMLGRDNPWREKLAAYITAPQNKRFAEVLVNRLWQRVMGWGLSQELSDWNSQTPLHPQLLQYLGRQLVAGDYDYKHVARLIFNSHAYQRTAVDGRQAPVKIAAAAPWIRRLTAEQVIDSLHQATGLPLDTEEITFDPSAQQHDDAFLNLGVARRAWQLTSLSNERDRPSLSLPKAAIVVECLEAFGWRGSRQEPVSHRETDANMVQPGVIANSSMSVRLSRMSEDSFFTQLALNVQTPDEFVSTAFEQVLARTPSQQERQVFVALISEGWQSRITTLALPEPKPGVHRGFVTWANHFDIRANQLMRDLEREIAAGPPPTSRLAADWRERAEDAVWALMNTPEFQFTP